MLQNKYTTPKLQLKMTNHILSIPSLPIELSKPTHEFLNIPILNLLLGNPYEIMTFSSIRQYLFMNKTSDHIKITNDNVYIDKYILAPFTTHPSTTISLDTTFFFYKHIDLKTRIKNNKKILIIKQFIDKKHINFELENYLIKYKNYDINNIKTLIISFKEKNVILDTIYQYKIVDYNSLNIHDIDKFMGMNDVIYINTVRMIYTTHMNNCYYDIINLPYLLFIFYITLNHLNQEGDLYIYHLFPMLSYSYIGLFYYVFTLFDSIENIYNMIGVHIGLFHLKKYNGESMLKKIFNSYYKIDPDIGLNNYVNNYNEYKIENCETKNSLITKHVNDKYINSIVTDIHPDFINYIYGIYINFNKKLSIFNEQCNNVKLKNVHSILSYNIQECKQFCNKHNIDISPLYENFKPLTYKKIIKKYFINKSNIIYDNLYMNVDSIYSITLPIDSIKICEHIKNNFKHIDTIIDGTSNVGTNTIVMAYYFKQIISCEIDEKTYEYLKKNIKEYKLKNIKTYCDSVIDLMKKLKYDELSCCLYLDPPWSGIHYKLEKQLDLYLDNINVIDFIDSIQIKYICMKVPSNFNISYAFKKFKNIQIYGLTSFFIILIIK